MNQELPTNAGVSKRTKKIILGIVITVICVPIFTVLFFVVLFFLSPYLDTHAADAGFRKAKKTIDPEELRLWALEEISKNPTNHGIFPPQILNSEIPSYMQKLYSERVEDAVIWKHAGNTNFTLLTLHSNSVEKIGQTNVTIFWGGPFFHWMFEIGSTNFVPPKDSQVTTVEWVPGVYYCREDTAHPFK
jgi:hypothetical protein